MWKQIWWIKWRLMWMVWFVEQNLGVRFLFRVCFPGKVSNIYLLGMVNSNKMVTGGKSEKYLRTWTSTSRVCRRLEWTIEKIHPARPQAQTRGSQMQAGSLGAEAHSVRGNSPSSQRCHAYGCLTKAASHRSHTRDGSMIKYPVETLLKLNSKHCIWPWNAQPLPPPVPPSSLWSLGRTLTESRCAPSLGRDKNTNTQIPALWRLYLLE